MRPSEETFPRLRGGTRATPNDKTTVLGDLLRPTGPVCGRPYPVTSSSRANLETRRTQFLSLRHLHDFVR
jgi:hypothetical protein